SNCEQSRTRIPSSAVVIIGLLCGQCAAPPRVDARVLRYGNVGPRSYRLARRLPANNAPMTRLSPARVLCPSRNPPLRLRRRALRHGSPHAERLIGRKEAEELARSLNAWRVNLERRGRSAAPGVVTLGPRARLGSDYGTCVSYPSRSTHGR